MSLTSLRYFGVPLVELELSSLRADTALGRFVPMAEPLPVGTTVELDGLAHRIVRVDESLSPGMWLSADGAARAEMPEMVTIRDIPFVPVPAPVDDAPTLATQIEAAAPEAVVASPSEKTDAKKRRRRGKTPFGH